MLFSPVLYSVSILDLELLFTDIQLTYFFDSLPIIQLSKLSIPFYFCIFSAVFASTPSC